ncbi:MAG: YdiU family protein [Rhodothermales bacterium]
MNIAFDNSYARELEGFYVPWQGAPVPKPEVVRLNEPLAVELGLDPDALRTREGAAILAGSVAPAGGSPLAQAYAGHQFGGFSPQLGDGRALLVGEVIDRNGTRRDIHLKGSGRTPFSRGGDGKAVLGPVLREYLVGEAMHALGIPTTRALAAVATGERVYREGPRPGAVLARVASSHLRVGTFQFFAARGDVEKVARLADYAIERHDPDLAGRADRYLTFLQRVAERQAALVARWMHVGFVHGVMNTDNMTISGETIDYGPCAFIDAYSPAAVFSSIDHQGRYAYGNQPAIARWNIARLAETLLALIDPEDEDRAVARATDVVDAFAIHYEARWLDGMRRKIGLSTEEEGDGELVADLLGVLNTHAVDFTQGFRRLAESALGQDDAMRALFGDPAGIDAWLAAWRNRLQREPLDPAQRAEAMNRVNPIYIPRNHLVEEALTAASDGDLAPFDTLLGVLADPFRRREGLQAYETPAPPSFGRYTTFCGT